MSMYWVMIMRSSKQTDGFINEKLCLTQPSKIYQAATTGIVMRHGIHSKDADMKRRQAAA